MLPSIYILCFEVIKSFDQLKIQCFRCIKQTAVQGVLSSNFHQLKLRHQQQAALLIRLLCEMHGK